MAADYVKTACIAVVFTNDLKHIHLHANGDDFDKIHNLAEEYYNQMTEETDYLCELAIENGQSMVNPTKALEKATGWIPEDSESYDYGTCLSAINVKLALYIESLYQLRDAVTFEDVKSKLDDIIRNWKKELAYKMAKRSNIASHSFVHSGIDDRTTQYAQRYFGQEGDV